MVAVSMSKIEGIESRHLLIQSWASETLPCNRQTHIQPFSSSPKDLQSIEESTMVTKALYIEPEEKKRWLPRRRKKLTQVAVIAMDTTTAESISTSYLLRETGVRWGSTPMVVQVLGRRSRGGKGNGVARETDRFQSGHNIVARDAGGGRTWF